MSSALEPLRCITCGGALSARDVDRARGVATCPNCTSVQPVGRPAPAAAPRDASPRAHAEGPGQTGALPIPERFVLSEQPGSLRVEWRWFRPSAIFLVGFCVFWDGFLVVWYGNAIATGSLMMAVFPLLHVAVGASLTYTALASLLNRTVVEVGAQGLSITHGPVPWKGARVTREELAQLYVEEQVSRGKNGTSVTWSLSAVLKSGRRQVLLKRLDEKVQAVYLERALEARLGITPQPVEGEVG